MAIKVLEGYSRVLTGYLKRYSRGTRGVLEGYSRGTRGVLEYWYSPQNSDDEADARRLLTQLEYTHRLAPEVGAGLTGWVLKGY